MNKNLLSGERKRYLPFEMGLHEMVISGNQRKRECLFAGGSPWFCV